MNIYARRNNERLFLSLSLSHTIQLKGGENRARCCNANLRYGCTCVMLRETQGAISIRTAGASSLYTVRNTVTTVSSFRFCERERRTDGRNETREYEISQIILYIIQIFFFTAITNICDIFPLRTNIKWQEDQCKLHGIRVFDLVEIHSYIFLFIYREKYVDIFSTYFK